MTHWHNCQQCGELFDCEAPQTANPDGIPYEWCLSYHEEDQTWCHKCLGQMLADQDHDAWWAGIGSDHLDWEQSWLGEGVHHGPS